MKKSKLREKSARIPNHREPHIEGSIQAYLKEVQELSREPARSQRFSILLHDLFGLELPFIEDYLAGMETYVRTRRKDRILRGMIDNLFGNLVIEFESDLDKQLSEAEGQLHKYIAYLWSEEEPQKRTPYLCLAADGVKFKVYSPQAPLRRPIEPEEVSLNEIESLDWREIPPVDIYFWLDRHFRRREILRPRTEQIVKDFGPRSHAFQVTGHALLSAWEEVKDERGGATGRSPLLEVVYSSWEKYLRITKNFPAGCPPACWGEESYGHVHQFCARPPFTGGQGALRVISNNRLNILL